MSEKPGPNIATDLLRIHRVITRGLQVSIERSQAFAGEGFPDDETRQGFVSYVQALLSMLHGHHVTEDDVAFPYFRDKLPEMPVDVLIAEHKKMEPIMEEIKSAIEGAAAAADPAEFLADLNRALTNMNALWHAHIGKEEVGFDPGVVGPMLAPEEHIRLAQAMAKHSQEHSGPAYLTVPFMLYNLSPQDRAALSAAMPPNIVQELVPVVWKEQWAPMKPFLLD